MIRKAKAVWHGTGRAGNGNLSTDSGVLSNTPYSFKTRFENGPAAFIGMLGGRNFGKALVRVTPSL